MRRALSRSVVVLLVFALAVGCGGAGDDSGETGEESVQVTATISVVRDLVEEVGGERVEVATLVQPGVDVHTFQPTPSDVQKISESRVVFQNGLGLEEWLDDLVRNAGGDVTVVELSEGLEPIEGEEHGHEEHGHEEHGSEEHENEAHEEHAGEDTHGSAEEGHEDEGAHDEHAEEEAGEHAHEHEGGNPHLWLDVANAGHYVERIRDALVEADPEGAETYEANAEEYLAELEELDGYIREQARTVPEENRKLVTFHDAFPYFAEAYGFEQVGVILQNPDAEPSSREVAEIVRTVEEEDVPAIFTEPQFNQGLSDTISQEAGVEVYELYSDALVNDPDANSYEAMMRTNIDRVVEGLGRS